MADETKEQFIKLFEERNIPETEYFLVSGKQALADFLGAISDPELKKDLLATSLDNKGNTALHIAAKEGNSELSKLLIEHGAESKATNSQGHTPKEIAEENNVQFMGRVLNLFGLGDYKDTTKVIAALKEAEEQLIQNPSKTPSSTEPLEQINIQQGANISSLREKEPATTPLRNSESPQSIAEPLILDSTTNLANTVRNLAKKFEKENKNDASSPSKIETSVSGNRHYQSRTVQSINEEQLKKSNVTIEAPKPSPKLTRTPDEQHSK
ncbi:MAG: ankyrin repeat domain-containing protein [Rickettsiales bacterium]